MIFRSVESKRKIIGVMLILIGFSFALAGCSQAVNQLLGEATSDKAQLQAVAGPDGALNVCLDKAQGLTDEQIAHVKQFLSQFPLAKCVGVRRSPSDGKIGPILDVSAYNEPLPFGPLLPPPGGSKDTSAQPGSDFALQPQAQLIPEGTFIGDACQTYWWGAESDDAPLYRREVVGIWTETVIRTTRHSFAGGANDHDQNIGLFINVPGDGAEWLEMGYTYFKDGEKVFWFECVDPHGYPYCKRNDGKDIWNPQKNSTVPLQDRGRYLIEITRWSQQNLDGTWTWAFYVRHPNGVFYLLLAFKSLDALGHRWEAKANNNRLIVMSEVHGTSDIRKESYGGDVLYYNPSGWALTSDGTLYRVWRTGYAFYEAGSVPASSTCKPPQNHVDTDRLAPLGSTPHGLLPRLEIISTILLRVPSYGSTKAGYDRLAGEVKNLHDLVYCLFIAAHSRRGV